MTAPEPGPEVRPDAGAPTAPGAAAPDVPDWHRLAPQMLLVHPVNELVRFFPVVIAGVVFGSSGDRGGWWYWLGVGIPVLIGILRFLTTTYRVTPTQVELRRGLLGRRVVSAPLDRVRSVELTSSPVHRLLGLAKVEIGTGSAARQGEEKLALDALVRPQAQSLRTALLQRAGMAPAPEQHAEGGTPPAPPAEQVLLVLEPSWARFAPFTSSGLVIAAAILAGLSQLGEAIGPSQLDVDVSDVDTGPWWVLLPVGLLVLLVVLTGLSVLGYAVTYGGFRLTLPPGGTTYHVCRGLLTRRETSLERDRVRGVVLHEPLPLRLAGGARLDAQVTGTTGSGGLSPLTPPAPNDVGTGLGGWLLGGTDLLVAPLRQHGDRALRRRYVRAMAAGAMPLLAAAALVLLTDGWHWTLVPGVALLALSEPLARDRYRRLGHGLDDRYLMVSSGSLAGRREVLERRGIIGWTVRQTWFQRRAGLCDLVATTAAGKQACTAYDVPLDVAVALAEEAQPALVRQFRA